MNSVSKIVKLSFSLALILTILISCGTNKETTSAKVEISKYVGEVLSFEEVDIIPHPIKSDNKLSSAEMEKELRMFYMEGIMRSFKYPSQSFRNNIQGRVLLKFVIDEKGSIRNVSIISGVNNEIDNAAINIIRSLKRVSPAVKDGKSIAVNYALPITYKIVRM